MTDQNASGAQAAPANAPAQPPTAAAPAPAAAPTASPSSVSMPTEAFNDRIARAKQSAAAEAQAELLKQLGVTDLSAAQAAIKAAADIAEKNKTDAQRVVELEAKLAAEKERGDVYEETLKERAARELETLPEDKRNAVLALAGDDAGAQILAIDTLKPTWAQGATASTPPATQTPPAAANAPANTAPPREAPQQTPGGQPDAYQTYLAIKAKNPFAAAEYRRKNAAAISAGETKQT